MRSSTHPASTRCACALRLLGLRIDDLDARCTELRTAGEPVPAEVVRIVKRMRRLRCSIRKRADCSVELLKMVAFVADEARDLGSLLLCRLPRDGHDEPWAYHKTAADRGRCFPRGYRGTTRRVSFLPVAG